MNVEYHIENIKRRLELLDCLRPEDQSLVEEYSDMVKDVEGRDRRLYLFSTFLTTLFQLSDTEAKLNELK